MPLACPVTVLAIQNPECDAASIETSCSGESMMKIMSFFVYRFEKEKESISITQSSNDNESTNQTAIISKLMQA